MEVFIKPEIFFYPALSTGDDYKFSILIPSWNNLDFLKLCIHSINKNSTYKHQIIVHVNEGSDGTLNWIQQQQLDYTYSKTNAGVCYALNAMRKLAGTNYILYLNDDMYVCPNWDRVLYDAIALKNNNLFYFSGTMIEPDDTGNKCVIANNNFGSNIKLFNEEALLAFTQNCSFNNWYGASWPPCIVHKEIWDKVSGYSEEFSPGFYSDPDFA